MPPIYVIDPQSMVGRGPFTSLSDAAADIEGEETSSDSLVLTTGESGEVVSVEGLDALDDANGDDEE